MLLALVAWGLGFAVRVAWLPGLESNPQALHGGHTALTATDSYFFAASAEDGLSGANAALRRLTPWTHHALTTFAVAAAQVAPVEDVLVWLPIVVAPLLVVPLLLFGHLLGATAWGFGAALLASVGWSYFLRTLPGYFDTDMFAVTLPVAVAAALAAAVARQRAGPAALAAALMAVGPFFYNQVGTVLLAQAGVFWVYLLLWHRRDAFAAPAAAAVALALLPLPSWARLLLVALAVVVHRRAALPPRHLPKVALALGLLAVAVSPALRMVVEQLDQYLHRDTVAAVGAGEVAFTDVGGLVREMVRLPWDELAERYAGSTLAFALGAVGLVLAGLRYRPVVLFVPLAALAAFAPWGGLRFTIYGAPLVALGLAWLAARAAGALTARLRAPRVRAWACAAVTAAALAPALGPQVEAALGRAPVPVVQAGEAELMARLGEVAAPGDYALTWWDFGYPLAYFAHVDTLVDGGKHDRDNLIASLALLGGSQRQAANLARVAVERYHAQPRPHAPVIDALFADARAAGSTPRAWLDSLARPDFTPPAATRQIFLYLPHRLLQLLGSVEQFSRDARRGPDAPAPFVIAGPARSRREGSLDLAGGYALDTRGMKLRDKRGRPVAVKAFHLVESDDSGAPRAQTQPGDREGRLHLVLLKRHGTALLCDEEVFASTFVQLYALGRHDPALFAPVLRTPFGAVYRVLR